MQYLNIDNASEFLMTSLGSDKNVLGRCDKEEVEEKYLQYMKEVEVDWDRCGKILKEYFFLVRTKNQLTNITS